ncbi:uncharacterized protein LOC134222647 [Armigeres subalbatus]|uniref:uncharacterized protein LOC134222647 n=1 Tax=Armigeres subalbatus TaxID=124917 RepID=UPI002ED12CA2
MTCDESFFSTLEKKNGPKVFLADGKIAKTAGHGEGTVLGVNGNGDAVDVKLVDVLYVPSLTSGLISVDKLTANGFTAVFSANGCEIRDATGSLTVVGERSGCLYRLKLAESSKKAQGKTHTTNCQHQWHRRFGHRHPDVIRIREEKLGTGMIVTDYGTRECCEPCLEEVDASARSGPHGSVRANADDDTRW